MQATTLGQLLLAKGFKDIPLDHWLTSLAVLKAWRFRRSKSSRASRASYKVDLGSVKLELPLFK